MTLYFQSNGSIKSLDLPVTVDDVGRFDDFCDFRAKEAEYIQAGNDEQPFEIVQEKLREALSVVVPGDLDSLPYAIDENDPKFIETTYRVQLDQPLSLLRVYAHLINVVAEYKPTHIPETFELRRWPWRKHRYRIKRGQAARMILDKPLSTGEAVECLEWKRITDQAVDANPLGVGNLEFTYGLTQMALLLRKPGEKLPHERRELDQFIARRQVEFAGLPLSVILDIRFFLIAALLNSNKTKDSNSFGTDLRVSNRKSVVKKRIGRQQGKKRGR